jgi:hypothetical protein
MNQFHDMPSPAARGLIFAIVAWSLAWKGVSLWRAAKDDSKPWFITLLVSNTAGILDSIYLFGVSAARRREGPEEKSIPVETGESERLDRTEEKDSAANSE